jgi:hypothetical protein
MLLYVMLFRSEEHTLYITTDTSASIELTVDGQILIPFNTLPVNKTPKQTTKVSVMRSTAWNNIMCNRYRAHSHINVVAL